MPLALGTMHKHHRKGISFSWGKPPETDCVPWPRPDRRCGEVMGQALATAIARPTYLRRPQLRRLNRSVRPRGPRRHPAVGLVGKRGMMMSNRP